MGVWALLAGVAVGSPPATAPSDETIHDFLSAQKTVGPLSGEMGVLDDGPGYPELVLLGDRAFRLRYEDGIAHAERGECTGALGISMHELDGKCAYRTQRRGDKSFRFKIIIHGIENGKMEYDIAQACIGDRCIVDRDLCWSANELSANEQDCSPRPLHAPLTKPTTAKILKFISSTDFRRHRETFMLGAASIILQADRTFSIWDLNNTMEPCITGTWDLAGATVRGKCKGSRETFSVTIGAVGADAVRYEIEHCPDGRCDSQRRCWGIAHGAQDDWCSGVFLQLIPGSKDRALFEAVEQQIRHSYARHWKAAGLDSMPTLFDGPPARTPRTASQIFFANDGVAAATATARLLAPAIGPVKPTPWPGPSDYNVIVVIGDRVAEEMDSER